MTTAWQNYHRRAAMARRVLEQIETSLDGLLPWDPAIAEVFDDPDDLLMALQQVWSNRLSAQVELALETGCEHVVESVGRARRELTYRYPGLRRLLDRYADEPALGHLRRVEHRMLAVAAGLATLDDPVDHAARTGELLSEAAEPCTARSYLHLGLALAR